MNKTYKLFISHSTKDAEYIEMFVELLEYLGMRGEDIICSSIPPYCVPLGNKTYDWLIDKFQHYNLHVVYAFSKNYYASRPALNEMGATWALKHRWTGILLPGFQFDELDGCIDKTQISIKLDDRDIRTLKYRLGELKDELVKEFNLRPVLESTWERRRDEFLRKIAVAAQKRINDQQYILMMEKEEVESALLLVYAADGSGRIYKSSNERVIRISVSGKRFMRNSSAKESVRWREALDKLLYLEWIKDIGYGGKVFEVTEEGYKKADILKERMKINTLADPAKELKRFKKQIWEQVLGG